LGKSLEIYHGIFKKPLGREKSNKYIIIMSVKVSFREKFIYNFYCGEGKRKYLADK